MVESTDTQDLDNKLRELLDKTEKDETTKLKIGSLYWQKYELKNQGSDGSEAVKWLLRASKTGNEEATLLLRKCFDNNIGINEDNIEDIEWCLNTSSWEKKGRSSARELFRKICAGGDTKLSKEEYNKRIEDFSKSKLERNLLEKAIKNEVDEDVFVDRMMRLLKGKNTWSLSALMETKRDSEEYKKLSTFKRTVYHSKKLLIWLTDNVVETAGTQGMLWLKALIPVHQIYMLLLLFIYSLVPINSVLYFIPIALFYIIYIFVLITTLQMFYSRKKLNSVKVLADMLDRLNDTLIHDSAESAYSWTSIKPYINFFIALPFLIASFSLADKQWIPSSEICLLSFVITVACWFALNDKYDYLALLAIILDTLSNLPILIEKINHIPVLYPILNAICSFGFKINLFFDLHFNIGLPSLAYIIVPLFFIKMATKSIKGFHQVIVPHLVCFFWWKLVVVFIVETTWFGLLRASCGWGMLLILSPLLFIAGFLWVIYTIYISTSFYNIFKVLTTFCLVIGVSLLPFWSRYNYKKSDWNLKQKSLVTNVILVVIFVITSVPLAFITLPKSDSNMNYLSRDVYMRSCVDVDGIFGVENCLHFNNLKVNWTGVVDKISITKIENRAEDFMKIFPKFVSNYLRCTYGQKYAQDCTTLSDQPEQDACQYNKLQGIYCHLNDFNKFTYEVMTSTQSNNEIAKLIIPDHFSSVIKALRVGDEVAYQGSLDYSIGSTIPTVHLKNLQCLRCQNTSPMVLQPSIWSFSFMYKTAFQSVFNFFFAPLFDFE